jgi:ClpP class serine protease
LSDFEAKKTAYIDGVAASAATVIACAADEVVARENTNYMIHNPWMVAIGTADTMRKAAEDLEAVTEPVMAVYRAKVDGKIDDAKIKQLMEDETWMTADKALEYGFVDKVRGKIRAISRANKSQILCSGRLLNVEQHGFRNVPDYPKIKSKKEREAAEAINLGLDNTRPTKEKEKPMTREDIDAALLATIENEARAKERGRLSELSAMNPANDADLAAIINKARDEGKNSGDIAMECLAVVQKQLAAAATVSSLASEARQAGGVAAGDAPIAKLFAAMSPEQQAQNRFSSTLAAAIKAQNPARRNGSDK